MARGANSFATFLILCPTSFFLGILFSSLPYDFPVLWTSSPPAPGHYDVLESHLRLLHAAPPLVPRILHIVIAVGLLGFVIKLYKPSEANTLFDGASLFLYMCAITVYLANLVKGLRQVSAGRYGESELVEGESAVGVTGDGPVGREDALRVLAASNTILALVLVGVLVLQAGQWYAERKEAQEVENIRREDADARKNGAGGSRSASGKKKQ
ncbi:MAG: hypothetical protein M1833_006536 [Piccolia ochrophora]|nr:MAG: hypothetical protein M1833_006536 [Piccolia ochrophora]